MTSAPKVNPFLWDTPATPGEKIKLAIMSFTVFPIRLVFLIATLMIMCLIARISIIGADLSRPLPTWRCALQIPIQYLSRLCLFICGFYWIRERGHLAAREDAPIIVAAPHSGPLEGFYLSWKAPVSALSMLANRNAPLLGTMLKATQAIWVDRVASSSRHDSLETIIKRSKTERGQWPRIAIFPEGLCTNRTCLVTFKKGAFAPGVPVQPVTINYPYRHFNFCTVAVGPPIPYLIWRLMCQFVNRMEVNFLPVSRPTSADVANPMEWARRVRGDMAAVLRVPVSNHTYEDVRLALEARNAHIPAAEGVVEYGSLSHLHNLNFQTVEGLLQQFIANDVDHSGTVNVTEFANALHLPLNGYVHHLFDLLDRKHTGSIHFREFLVGMLMLSETCNKEDAIKFAFEMFDDNHDGKISRHEFRRVLRAGYPTITNEQLVEMFNEVDTDHSGAIDYVEFSAWAKQHPQYMFLFADQSTHSNTPLSPSGRGDARPLYSSSDDDLKAPARERRRS